MVINRRRFGYRNAVLAAVVATSTWVVGSGCIGPDRCKGLRAHLLTERNGWQAGCNVDDDCVVLAGQSSDCTGVFSCNIAVLKSKRVEAEDTLINLSIDSQLCTPVCAQINCITNGVPKCDTSHEVGQCFLFGDPTPTTPEVDSGTAVVVTEPPADASRSD